MQFGDVTNGFFSTSFFFKDFFFLMWTIYKVFIEFVTILLLFFMFWFFGNEACGILVRQSGIEPAPPALEGKVLTSGLPGKSLFYFYICFLETESCSFTRDLSFKTQK